MNQLVAESVKHIVDGERALFLRHFSVKKHLQQEIAQARR